MSTLHVGSTDGDCLNTLDRIDTAEIAALDDFFQAAPSGEVVRNGLLGLQRDGALILRCDTYAVLGFNRAFGISETRAG